MNTHSQRSCQAAWTTARISLLLHFLSFNPRVLSETRRRDPSTCKCHRILNIHSHPLRSDVSLSHTDLPTGLREVIKYKCKALLSSFVLRFGETSLPSIMLSTLKLKKRGRCLFHLFLSTLDFSVEEEWTSEMFKLKLMLTNDFYVTMMNRKSVHLTLRRLLSDWHEALTCLVQKSLKYWAIPVHTHHIYW